MRNFCQLFVMIFVCAMSPATVTNATAQTRPVVIYGGSATELRAARPFTESQDLWVTLADLARATGFVVKPQGVCRGELCFPLPRAKKDDFLALRAKITWFNLSSFARLVHQPVARDAQRAVWSFGSRPEAQNSFLQTLQARTFTLPDPSGKRHSLSDFRGKKVLLITWASW